MKLFLAPAAILLAPLAMAQLPDVGTEGGPLRELDAEESAKWLAGRALFEKEWSAEEGLGSPHFNAVSCATCHKDPAVGGAGANEFNVIQSSSPSSSRGNSLGFSHYGGGLDPEARRRVRRGPRAEPAPEPINRLTVLRDRRKERAAEGMSEKQLLRTFPEIQTPSLLGLGLIDSIPAEEILRREDPEDRDQNGIRGFARLHTVDGEVEVGRFGWKAQTPRLVDFVCMALQGEVGLTAPDQGRGFGSDTDFDDAEDPEVPDESFAQLNFFLEELAAPTPSAEWKNYQAQVGERLFGNLGCAQCHVPELKGANGPVRLYSDLLLHDVTPDDKNKERLLKKLAERRERGLENPAEMGLFEMRTPPLWGIAKTAPYWHDGSAADLHAAVLAHHGEAERSRESYSTLESIDQEALVAYLQHL